MAGPGASGPGLENRLIRPEPRRTARDRAVHRRSRLGEMLNTAIGRRRETFDRNFGQYAFKHGAGQRHCTLIPATLTMLLSFSTSARTNRSNSSGVFGL